MGNRPRWNSRGKPQNRAARRFPARRLREVTQAILADDDATIIPGQSALSFTYLNWYQKSALKTWGRVKQTPEEKRAAGEKNRRPHVAHLDAIRHRSRKAPR